MHAMLKHDTYYDVYFLYLPFCIYLIDESWMISIDVVIHSLRWGLAIVLRCWGLSKVRCGGEGLVLHGVW
jgi:hypothetical protein